jgi:flavin reductase (DIM6/NTAB) family NADH-FMN oxidoreductase RutF
MQKKAFPLAKVYTLLEPGPVLLMCTVDAKGRANLMPQSWHTMLEFEPPLVGCVVSNRNHSFGPLRTTRECTLNIPDASIAEQVARCGNCSGRRIDKFRRFGLTPVPAMSVRPPLVDECFACLECRVVDTRMVAAYGLFVLEVKQAWADGRVRAPQTLHHRGRGRFMTAGPELRLRSRAK